ncbi:uncharacterized protein LOC126567192 [Anopheles maculipalpis]|uniref:uncharacterized protein LOC126567192 n=1 Tax=Anopheles maculipalpis TaxID=1496333 RepID=UPI002158FF6A|nr:uncharacterized protein LOC126567192 [Anopheles maculipalpis]
MSIYSWTFYTIYKNCSNEYHNIDHILCVLIFPPFSSYRRFLIHRVCASRSFNQHEIVTFSIGIGDERRTVVCFRHQLLQDVKANIGKRFEESAASGEYGTTAAKPSHYASWRSSTTPPTASTSTITTTNSSCGGRHQQSGVVWPPTAE